MMRLLAFLLVFALPVWAVEPGEQLADRALEARARSISTLLRCPQCQSENIDNSNATIARDIRLFVRERLVAGDSDQQVVDAVVARYGEFVLFLPQPAGINWGLWLGGPFFLFIGFLIVSRTVRRRVEEVDLTAEEEAKFDRLLKDD
ncbi:MAG: cytochrome c-type biogenesis protein [Deltaproteobacteria bacterium]